MTQEDITSDTVDLNELNLLVQGVEVFTHGMMGYKNGEKEKLNEAIMKLNDMKSNAETKMVFGTPKMCSGVSRNLQPPSVNEVNSVKVLECELKSFMAMLNNNEKLAEKWMKEAIKLEGDTKYIYGPPNIVKPSFELYGEWLLSKGREEEAKEQFDIVMERSPKRRLSVKGLEKLNS